MSKKNPNQHFADGRNGMDVLNWILFALVLILLILGTVFSSYIPLGIALLLIIWFTFRALSRNAAKRQKENQVPMRAWQAVVRWFKLQKLRWTDRKIHVYKKCPSCRKVLRFKRHKGKKQVSCPYCGTTFTVIIHIKGEEDRSNAHKKQEPDV